MQRISDALDSIPYQCYPASLVLTGAVGTGIQRLQTYTRRKMIYTQHTLSAAYPAMQASEYQALLDSINEIGVQNAITLFEGQVIDGWHRYKAATELGMACPTVEMGDVDPRDFAKSQGARRNITASQNALAITAIYAWAPVGKPVKPNMEVTSTLAKTNAELAAIAGVSTKTIQQAKAVQASGVQAVQDAVKTGIVSVETAAAVAKLPAKEQKKVAAKGADAMRAAAKPHQEPANAPQIAIAPLALVEEYTELDAAHDQITELQSALAIANIGSADPEEAAQAKTLIADLRQEVKVLRANLKAVTTSRDTLQNELAMVKRQCVSLQSKIKKAA